MPAKRRLATTATVLAVSLATLFASLALAASAVPTAATAPATSTTTHSAVLNATVNPNGLSTTYAFQYGTTTNYGSQTSTRSVGSGSSAVAAQVTVSNLASGTTYHYRVVATNPLGTVAGADVTFTTVAELPVVVLTKPSLVTDSSVTLTGTVNPNGRTTSYTFQYGTTAGYGLQSSPVSLSSGTATKSVAATVSGLASGTTYYYRLVATSSAGTSVSGGLAFVTTGNAVAPGGPAPVVSQAAAVKITSTSVQLNGAINPEGDPTTWHFEYGLTSSYGLETTPQTMLGLGIRPINSPITGLRSGTTYYYRLVATSANGLYVGPGLTFTTKAVPPAAPRSFTATTTHWHGRHGLHLTVSGTLSLPLGVGIGGCTGPVTIRFQRSHPGGPTFMLVHTQIQSDCTYALTTWFSYGHLHGLNHFGITVRFAGNPLVQGTIRQRTVFICSATGICTASSTSGSQ